METAKNQVQESTSNYKKTKPKKVDNPSSSVISSFGFSISNTKIQDKKEEKTPSEDVLNTVSSDAAKTPFTQAELLAQWDAYAKLLTKPSEQAALSILNSIKPSLGKDFKLSLELHSKTQEAEFDKIKPQLIPFLREQLKNFHISISIVINKESTNITPYTAEEKFNFMLKKNEALAKLKNDLNLDLGH